MSRTSPGAKTLGRRRRGSRGLGAASSGCWSAAAQPSRGHRSTGAFTASTVRLWPACRSTRSRRSRTVRRHRQRCGRRLCAGAVRRWLVEHDELPDTRWWPRCRSRSAAKEQRGTFGNRIGMMSVPLFTNEPDPVRTPATDPRGAPDGQGHPPGAAGPAAPGRDPVHPARRVRARGPGHVLTGRDPPRFGTWSSRTSRASVPAVLRGRAGRGQLPGVA